MKTISINTTQNVVIEHELASLKDRIFAFLIDLIVLVFGGLMFIGIIGSMFIQGGIQFVVYIWLVIFIFYSLVSEYITNGQSLGKKALRLKVVKISGEEAGFGDYVARWAFRLVDIYMSAGTVASMMISSSLKGQRLGDSVANTAVVYVRPAREVSVNQILNALNNQKYSITFPEARTFTDAEMLVLKQVIERAEKYNNPATEEALIEAANIVRQRMGIQENFYNYRKFLKTVLTDYVVLTR